jgi:hypothetical protein
VKGPWGSGWIVTGGHNLRNVTINNHVCTSGRLFYGKGGRRTGTFAAPVSNIISKYGKVN